MVEEWLSAFIRDWNSGGAAFGSGSRRLVCQRFPCPSEVSLAALHFEAVLYGDHLDRPIFSIWIKVRWLVAQSILIAQRLLDLAKCFRQLTFIASGQNVSSGGSGKQIQHGLAFWIRINYQIVRAKREHENFGSCGGFLGAVHERAAGGVHTIGNKDDRATGDLRFRRVP